MIYCDLHCHSSFSDGTCTPEELIDLAVQKHLGALALTDHNTFDGVNRFLTAAEGRIEVCSGCEFTTELDGQELHLVGLFLNPEKREKLQLELDKQVIRKEESNRDTIERLAEAGYNLSYDEFVSLFGTGIKNRVHIARYMIQKGILNSVSEAFDGLLSPKNGFYKEVKKLNFYKMISEIRRAEGISVWAHPLFHISRSEFESILPKAWNRGLDAVETYYSTYSQEDTAFLQSVCQRYSLLESGGSDFHGENKPGLEIGIGYGDLKVPMDCYEKLKEAAIKRQKSF